MTIIILQKDGQAARQSGCFLQLTSWGMNDDVWEGSIQLDGQLVADISHVSGEQDRYRGVGVLLLQKNITTGHCDVISFRKFDFYLVGDKEKAEDLKNHLSEQPAGTVITVVTGDEVTGAREIGGQLLIPGSTSVW